MHSQKLQCLLKITKSMCLAQTLEVKFRYISSSSNYTKEYDDKGHGKGINTVDNRRSWAEKLSNFSNQMTKCEDPFKKYDYLVELRDNNLELYLSYLQDNGSEVLSVLNVVKIDKVDDFCRKDKMIFNECLKMKRSDHSIKPLNVANTMDLLRQQVSNLRETNSVNLSVGFDPKTDNEKAISTFQLSKINREEESN